MKYSFSLNAGSGIQYGSKTKCKAPSYSGLVRRPLTAVTRVRIPLGSQNESPGTIRFRGIFLCPKFVWISPLNKGESSMAGSSGGLLKGLCSIPDLDERAEVPRGGARLV